MIDRRLWQLANKAAFNPRLCSHAHRLVDCLCQTIYKDPAMDPEDFYLPISQAGRWMQLKDPKTIRVYLTKLQKEGILMPLGKDKCQGANRFRIPLDLLIPHPTKPLQGKLPLKPKTRR